MKSAHLILRLSLIAIILRTIYGWFEIYSVYASPDQESLVLRVLTLLPAIVASLIYACTRDPNDSPPLWKFTHQAAGALLVLGPLVGLYFGNSVRYLVGDLFRYAVFWCSLSACLAASRTLATYSKNSLEAYFYAIGALAVADSAATAVLAGLFPFAKISTVFYLTAWIWSLTSICRQPVRSFSLLLVCGWAVLISGKRGALIAVIPATVIALTILVLSKELRLSRLLSAAMRVTFLLTVIYFCQQFVASVSPEFVTFTQDRWLRLVTACKTLLDQASDVATADQSYRGRIDEYLNVRREFLNRPALFFFGKGFGAEVPITEGQGCVESASGMMHHVHITWVLYFLRHGPAGVCLVALYFLSGLTTWFRTTSTNGRYLAFVFGQLTLEFFLAAKSNVLIESVPLPIACGIALATAGTARHNPANIKKSTVAIPKHKVSFLHYGV